VDLAYNDREAGHLLGVWFVAVGLLALLTTRPAYSSVLHPVADRLVFSGLVVCIGIGAVVERYRDPALGVPMVVCGGLVIVICIRSLLVGSVPIDAHGLLTGVGVCGLGGLFVREGLLIARGRRHRTCQPQPSTRWQWWLGATAVVVLGVLTA